ETLTDVLAHQHQVGDGNLVGAHFGNDFGACCRVYGGRRAIRRIKNDETHGHQRGEADDDGLLSSFKTCKLFEHLVPFPANRELYETSSTVATLHEMSVVRCPLSVVRCQLFVCETTEAWTTATDY